jgi:RES domain
MNAEGIPIFYGAKDAQTCLAELRPPLGETAAIISVEIIKPVRMLDFTRMITANKALSYFQPNFIEQSSRLKFVRRLARLISRPITGHESEY